MISDKEETKSKPSTSPIIGNDGLLNLNPRKVSSGKTQLRQKSQDSKFRSLKQDERSRSRLKKFDTQAYAPSDRSKKKALRTNSSRSKGQTSDSSESKEDQNYSQLYPTIQPSEEEILQISTIEGGNSSNPYQPMQQSERARDSSNRLPPIQQQSEREVVQDYTIERRDSSNRLPPIQQQSEREAVQDFMIERRDSSNRLTPKQQPEREFVQSHKINQELLLSLTKTREDPIIEFSRSELHKAPEPSKSNQLQYIQQVLSAFKISLGQNWLMLSKNLASSEFPLIFFTGSDFSINNAGGRFIQILGGKSDQNNFTTVIKANSLVFVTVRYRNENLDASITELYEKIAEFKKAPEKILEWENQKGRKLYEFLRDDSRFCLLMVSNGDYSEFCQLSKQTDFQRNELEQSIWKGLMYMPFIPNFQICPEFLNMHENVKYEDFRDAARTTISNTNQHIFSLYTEVEINRNTFTKSFDALQNQIAIMAKMMQEMMIILHNLQNKSSS